MENELELMMEHGIVYVHPDFSEYASIGVGFDEQKNLVFNMFYNNADYAPRYKWKRMFIDEKGIKKLAFRMRTTVPKLPEAFSEKFGSEGEASSVRDVYDTYNYIASYLYRNDVHYREEKIVQEE